MSCERGRGCTKRRLISSTSRESTLILMSPLLWYWHRLRAMEPAEIAAHVRKKILKLFDGPRRPDPGSLRPVRARDSPQLPRPEAAPRILREALALDTREIIEGRWKAFGHLGIQVEDPPSWHKDYLVGNNLATNKSAFRLNHRKLPGGADIKLIWELSRWHQLIRLAMAAYVLRDERAGWKCLVWLNDWLRHNPPYRGWNWTSALEAGMRLVQFTWIDALLIRAVSPSYRGESCVEGPNGKREEIRTPAEPDAHVVLGQLRREILPAHIRFAWRYRSFGSSANNHLLGELAGLILAIARWPELERWATSLEALTTLWEREVLTQFAEDGGNKEQALNYHLFSWEFCWQTRAALLAAGHRISSDVEERLRRAAKFFWEVQVPREPWDYGDSDNGLVSPFFVDERTALTEWRDWLNRSPAKAALDYWIGGPPKVAPPPGRSDPSYTERSNDWRIYPDSGYGTCESGDWWLRWDLSPLGLHKTAAHGHVDALHLSIWIDGVAIVVDPGTGAYYSDPQLRTWLASREAHNGPSPARESHPVRMGTFLWSKTHEAPRWNADAKGGITADWRLANGSLTRRVVRLVTQDGWQVEDSAGPWTVPADFSVRWQFAPGTDLKVVGERRFWLRRRHVSVLIELGAEWAEVQVAEQGNLGPLKSAATSELEAEFAGTVSPAFRKVEWGPYLKLVARPGSDKTCVFRTTFLASRGS